MLPSTVPARASWAKSACRITASGVRSEISRLSGADSPARRVVTWALGQWLVTWWVSHWMRLVSPPTTTRLGPASAIGKSGSQKSPKGSRRSPRLTRRDFTFHRSRTGYFLQMTGSILENLKPTPKLGGLSFRVGNQFGKDFHGKHQNLVACGDRRHLCDGCRSSTLECRCRAACRSAGCGSGTGERHAGTCDRTAGLFRFGGRERRGGGEHPR